MAESCGNNKVPPEKVEEAYRAARFKHLERNMDVEMATLYALGVREGFIKGWLANDSSSTKPSG